MEHVSGGGGEHEWKSMNEYNISLVKAWMRSDARQVNGGTIGLKMVEVAE